MFASIVAVVSLMDSVYTNLASIYFIKVLSGLRLYITFQLHTKGKFPRDANETVH